MTAQDDFLGQYRPATAATYRRSLDEFVRLTGRLDDATQDDVLRYHRAIRQQAPATTARKLSALNTFLTYLIRRRIRPDNPMDAMLRRPRVDRLGSRRWLSLDQQRAVLVAVGEAREAALLALLIGGGLRVSEAQTVGATFRRVGSEAIAAAPVGGGRSVRERADGIGRLHGEGRRVG